jgi:hypothetical protein
MDLQNRLDDAGYLQYTIWLCEHLSLLASDAIKQATYLRAIGTWDLLDELGLEWDNYYDVLRSQGKYSTEQLNSFNRVSDALGAVPKAAWYGPEFDPIWDSVRSAAAEALPVALEIFRALDPSHKIITPGTKIAGKTFIGTNSHTSLPSQE